MKTIKLREFQRHLHKIIKEGGEYEIVREGGTVVGRFNTGGSFTMATIAITPVINEIKEDDEVCMKCEKSGVQYEVTSPNDFGEYINFRICETCYKIFRPRNFKKI